MQTMMLLTQASALPTKNQSINIPKLMTKEAGFVPVGNNAAEIKYFKTNVLNKTPYKGNFKIVYKHYYDLFY
jgi:hypothetical protein